MKISQDTLAETIVRGELGWMRRAVFGEPLRAHAPKIGWIDAPASTRLVEHQRATGCDEKRESEQHGPEAARTRP